MMAQPTKEAPIPLTYASVASVNGPKPHNSTKAEKPKGSVKSAEAPQTKHNTPEQLATTQTDTANQQPRKKPKKQKKKKKPQADDLSRTASKTTSFGSTDDGNTTIIRGSSEHEASSQDIDQGEPVMFLTYCCSSLYYKDTADHKAHRRSKPVEAHHIRFKKEEVVKCCTQRFTTIDAFRRHMRTGHRKEQLRWQQEVNMHAIMNRAIQVPEFPEEELLTLSKVVECCGFFFTKVETLETHLDNCHNLPDWYTRKDKVQAMQQCRTGYESYLEQVRLSLPLSEHNEPETYKMAEEAFLEATNDIINGWNTRADLQQRMNFANNLDQWRAAESADWGPMWNVQVSDNRLADYGHYDWFNHAEAHDWDQTQSFTPPHDETGSPRARQQGLTQSQQQHSQYNSPELDMHQTHASPNQSHRNVANHPQHYEAEQHNSSTEYLEAFASQLDSVKYASDASSPDRPIAHALATLPRYQDHDVRPVTNKKKSNGHQMHPNEPLTPSHKLPARPAQPPVGTKKTKPKTSPKHRQQTQHRQVPMQTQQFGPTNGQYSQYHAQNMAPNYGNAYGSWYGFNQANGQMQGQLNGHFKQAHAYSANVNTSSPWSTSPWSGFSAQAKEFVPSLSFGSPAPMGTGSVGSFETNPKAIQDGGLSEW